ncbi:glycoside hydrolase family 13 protein [Parathielavia appendiculata]|uniref:alpha-amylase n=1 Tax=Parathielavia appendiculata TaxID=2587402 RepID=A0AAN6TTN8_9PEZI|nr:glycoside hydrolase family 13 protein [Parathielavia appendiculata]
MRTSIIGAAVATVLAFADVGSAANATEWKSRSIYQVMIDRYARTDGSTDATCEMHEFCGGTWKGLLNNLDYIQGMGFTAIQISPIVKNIDDDTSAGAAYHGYWPVDNYALNEKFGTEQDFKDLVDELHKRDILLMVDVVVNHMAQAFDNVVPPKVDYSKFNPFNDEKYFHSYCNVTDWENATNYQDCWLYPYGIALADLATEKTEVADEMNKWVKELVANYSIDGLRIDAAKHVNDEFLPAFVEASGVFALGEVLTGKPDDMCRYQTLGLLPGMPNYLDFYKLNLAFNGGSMVNLTDIRNEGASACNDTLALGSFIENHDMPRFASLNDDLALAKNAMAYVLLNDGIPTVYQGQEQHFKGNGTPFNREPLWDSKYNKSAPLYTLTSTLNKVRNNAIKRSSDYISSPSKTLWADVNHLCLSKGPYGSQVVFCINNKSSKGDSYQVSVGGFQANDKVVEVLTCKTSTADATGNVTMYMRRGEPKAYVLASVLNGTGICNTTVEDGLEQGNGAGALGATTSMLLAAVIGSVVVLLA